MLLVWLLPIVGLLCAESLAFAVSWFALCSKATAWVLLRTSLLCAKSVGFVDSVVCLVHVPLLVVRNEDVGYCLGNLLSVRLA